MAEVPPSPLLIGAPQAALMRRRVSIIVATRDAALRPHLVRAIGSRLLRDRRELVIFVDGAAAHDVLADVRANAQVAVVFSEPSSHESVQIKGRDARVQPLAEGDHALVEHYVECFADEIATLGHPRELVRTMFDHRADDRLGIRFTPAEAYEQTPGPAAGRALAPSTS